MAHLVEPGEYVPGFHHWGEGGAYRLSSPVVVYQPRLLLSRDPMLPSEREAWREVKAALEEVETDAAH